MSSATTVAINTQAFASIGDAIELLARRDGIVAVYGPPGTGKSYAAQIQVALTSTDSVSAVCAPAPTTRQLVLALLFAADQTLDLTGTEPTLCARLSAALSDGPLLVIDNAHELDHRCYKLLRRLHLGPDATCPLLLIGEEALAHELNAQPWTRARTLDLIEVGALSPDDIAEALPAYHPLYRDGDMRALLWIDRTFAHGRWSHWARVTSMAAWLHHRAAFERLDRDSAALILSHVR